MSIANLITNGNKSYQDLDIDNLTCKTAFFDEVDSNNINSVGTTQLGDLFVNNITSAGSDINFLSNTNHNNNDVIGINNLDVVTLNATTINGNISDDIIDVNEINQKDNGFIQMNNQLTMNNKKIFITDNLEATTSNECQLHITNNQDVCIFLESDRNNGPTEDDIAFLTMSQDGNATVGIFSLDTANRLNIRAGSTGGSAIAFNIGSSNNTPAGERPSAIDQAEVLLLTETENTSKVNLNLNAKDILNVNNLECDNILSKIDGTTVIMSNNGSTPSVKFEKVDFHDIGSIYLNQAGVPPIGPALNEGQLYSNNLGQPIWRNSTFSTNMFNPYSNDLAQIGSPTFAGLTLNGNVDMTNSNILNLNDANLHSMQRDAGGPTTTIDVNSNFNLNNNSINSINSCSSSRVNTDTLSDNNGINPLSVVGQGVDFTVGTPLILTGRVLNNSATKVLVLNASNNVEYRDSATLGGALYYVAAESDAESTTTLLTYQLKVSMSTAALALGDYKLSWSYEVTNNNANRSCETRVVNNAVTINECRTPSLIAANDYNAYSGFKIFTAISGVQTITIDFRTVVGGTAKIRRARLFFEEI